MSVLSPSGLETVNYNQSNWHHILDNNFEKVAWYLSKLERLLDVDTDLVQRLRRDGTILIWNGTKFVPAKTSRSG